MNTSLNLRRNEKKPGRRTDDDELLEILSIIIIIAPLVDICVVKLLLKTLLASHLTHFSFALLIKMSPPSSATKKKRRRRRFAIVDCEDEVEFSYVAIAYSRLLSFSSKSSSNSSSNQEEEEEEIWEHHRVPEGELPDMSEIETYDGIVITGSRHSAVDGVKSMRWMKHLKQFLERVARLRE